MPDELVGGGNTSPAPSTAPTNTQSAPLPLTQPPTSPARPLTPMPPAAPPKPGEFLHNLSQSFVGSLLGAMAGREKVTSYQTDAEGKQTPVIEPKTPHDQLRDIARSALLGLAASSQVGPRKSGIGSALAGFGAGAEDAVERAKERDLLLRKQSTEEYERGQQAQLTKAQNAHIAIQTMGLAQDLYNKTLESQEKVAAIGKDQYNALVEVGNAAPVSDLHKDDLLKWKAENSPNGEYMDYVPLLTKVLPKDGAVPDPKTGMYSPDDIDRYYSLINLKKNVPITQTMVDHLKAVNFTGAENLGVGTKVPAAQYAALWHQGLVRFNSEESDPRNIDVITSAGPNGLPIMSAFNKATKSLQVLKDQSGQPLTGKLPDRSGVDELFNKVKPDGARQYPNTTNGYLQATRDYKAAEQQGEIEGSSFKLGNARIPIGYQPPADSIHMNESDLRTTLQAKGVQLPENFSTLYAVGHYKADPNVFTKGLRKGVPQISESDAIGLVRNLVNSNYDQNKWDQVKELKKGFANLTPSAPGGQLVAFNTAAAHLGDLYTAAAALKNGPNSIKALNEIAQRYGVETNQSAPAIFGAIRAAVSREIGKTFEGGSPDVNTARDIQENINRAQSTDVIQDVARTNARLMVDKAGSLVDAYHAITDDFPDNSTNPSAVAALDKMGIDSSRIGGHAPRQTGQAGIPGLPPGAIAGRDTNGNIVGYSQNGKYVALPQPIAAQGGR